MRYFREYPPANQVKHFWRGGIPYFQPIHCKKKHSMFRISIMVETTIGWQWMDALGNGEKHFTIYYAPFKLSEDWMWQCLIVEFVKRAELGYWIYGEEKGMKAEGPCHWQQWRHKYEQLIDLESEPVWLVWLIGIQSYYNYIFRIYIIFIF